ncbi:MAG: flagellar hook assembly protein FlgD [Acetobacterales bacterium]
MAIDGISGGGQTAASKSTELFGQDLDRFLTLLTTQLRNQDPLEPMDATEFTQQLVQFAGIEQQIQTNTNLETLQKINETQQLASLSSYLGKTVSAAGGKGVLADGKLPFAYTLGEESASTRIVVTNAEGVPIYTTTGDTLAGNHEFVWNGKNAAGQQQPDGVYGVSVTAFDAEGESTKLNTTAEGVVTGIEVVDGVPYLGIGDLKVPLSDLTSVKNTGQS